MVDDAAMWCYGLLVIDESIVVNGEDCVLYYMCNTIPVDTTFIASHRKNLQYVQITTVNILCQYCVHPEIIFTNLVEIAYVALKCG